MWKEGDQLDDPRLAPDWAEDCQRWRKRLLVGCYWHWCPAWDGLPVDETCDEWPCECADDLRAEEKAKE